MNTKPRKSKPAQPPAAPIEWPRADPAELAKFDPASKVCTMNCSPLASDPRSRAERLFLCGDCDQQVASPMAELEALRRDADRYRVLREQWVLINRGTVVHRAAGLDAWCDERLAAKP